MDNLNLELNYIEYSYLKALVANDVKKAESLLTSNSSDDFKEMVERGIRGHREVLEKLEVLLER